MRSKDEGMNRLKQWAHRNRLVAQLVERSKDRQRARAFATYLHETLGVAVGWQSRSTVVAHAREQLARLQAIPAPAPRKGSPSKVAIRAPDLALIAAHLDQERPIDEEALSAAARVASVDPEERTAFGLYLAILWLNNESVVQALRTATRKRIVLHMTCVPRLLRADLSIQSFAGDEALAATHLKLVGNDERYAFDATNSLVSAHSKDSYECLPQKVFYGLALLTLACNPECILKLDDDHRLKATAELDRLLTFASSSSEPMQLGEVNWTSSPSAHHRAWHFEKCANASLNHQLLEMPAPTKWAAGSSGYILNRPALWRILWASLYYRQWLDQILYEDIALAEVASKTGIRIVHVPLSRAIGAVSEY
jgi:hypothetical protein